MTLVALAACIEDPRRGTPPTLTTATVPVVDLGHGTLEFEAGPGAPDARRLGIRNRGDGDLVVRGLVSDTPEFGTPSFLPYTLRPGEGTWERVTFAPTAFGLYQGVLDVYTTDPASPIRTVRLIGAGVGFPDVRFSSDDLSIAGAWPCPAGGTVWLRNLGEAAAHVDALEVDGATFALATEVPDELPPGFEAELGIVHSPDDLADDTGLLRLASADVPAGELVLALSASTAPELAAEQFLATAGQATFALAAEPLAGSVTVALDGVATAAWTLDGTTLTLTDPLPAGVLVEIGYATAAACAPP